MRFVAAGISRVFTAICVCPPEGGPQPRSFQPVDRSIWSSERSLDAFGVREAFLLLQDRMQGPLRKFIVGLSLQTPAGGLLARASPLLEEEGNHGTPALVPDGEDPLFPHRPRAWAAFTSHNHPTDPLQIEFSQVFQEGFDGEKSDSGGGGPLIIDPRGALLSFLHADAPPDMGLGPHGPKPFLEGLAKPRRG